MEEKLEMILSPCYNEQNARRIRLLKLLRIALVICLFMAWTYGIAVAAAFARESSGAATLWMMEFVIFTIPATVLLILVWIALIRLNRVYEYILWNDRLELWSCRGDRHRKLLAEIQCRSLAAFAPVDEAEEHHGRVIRAVVDPHDHWALDVRHEGQTVRVLLQPNPEFIRRLKQYEK